MSLALLIPGGGVVRPAKKQFPGFPGQAEGVSGGLVAGVDGVDDDVASCIVVGRGLVVV